MGNVSVKSRRQYNIGFNCAKSSTKHGQCNGPTPKRALCIEVGTNIIVTYILLMSY